MLLSVAAFGNDTVSGGGGNDVIVGGEGAGDDSYFGGTGFDLIRYTSATAAIRVDLNAGTASSRFANQDAGIGNDRLNGIEAAVGGSGDDVLIGGSVANVLIGEDGDDTLQGRGGSDTLDGGEGRDTASFADSSGSVVVTLSGGNVVYATVGGLKDDRLRNIENLLGGPSGDRLTGDGLDNVLNGNAGDDTLAGGGGTDTLIGASGKDLLKGGAGSDVLFGDVGVDTLLGGTDGDTLAGGLGNDVLSGQAGSDFFRFDTTLGASNIDRITDFSAVDDTFQLDNAVFTVLGTEGVLAAGFFRASATGMAADADDYILYNTTIGTLSFDVDGNGAGAAVTFATLTSLPAVTAADFVVV